MNGDSRELQNSRDKCGTRLAAQRRNSLEMCRKRSGLAEKRRRRPFTAAILSFRQCRKTAYVFQPLHGRGPPYDNCEHAIESVPGKIEKINHNQEKYKRVDSTLN
jgi:hypothetical protein